MSVLFDLVSILFIDLFGTGNEVRDIRCRGINSRLLSLGNVHTLQDGLSGSIHPVLTIDLLKGLGHAIEKFLIDRLPSGTLLLRSIDLDHEPVQKLHDLLIVIGVFLISEDDLTFKQQIILKCISFVHRSHTIIETLIHI